MALLTASPGQAAQTITVGTTADAVDPSPADGVCQAPCPLRAAIQTANGAGSPGLDTIVLAAQPYALSIAGADEDASATGDLDITSDVSLTGAGAGSTSIDGGDVDRVLDVRSGTVEIAALTLRNGKPPSTPPFSENGGGLRTAGSSVVSVHDATITQNEVVGSSGGGGAEANDTSKLTLTRVTVSSNDASKGDSGGAAGGVGGNGSAGLSVKVIDSTVTGNKAHFAGGVYMNFPGALEITRSTVSGNSTVAYPEPSQMIQTGGGVIEGGGSAVIADSVITGNTATYGGGVVSEGGSLTITRTTISGNRAKAVAADSSPGERFPYSNGVGAGLLSYRIGSMSITGTTFSGNVADLHGGGLAFQANANQPAASLTNVTIANNRAGTGGGGIRDDAGNLSLTNVTIDGNTAPIGAALNFCSGGPPIPTSFFTCAGTIGLRNSIVTGGCSKAAGAFASAGRNIDSGNTCGLNAAGDKRNANPLLRPLAANGGPTQTKALQDGSPAIDAATNCPAADQRGVARPFGAGCDIGAFEGGRPRVAAAPPQCQDGRDNDGDGAVDARDPGCQSAADANEGDETLNDLVLCGRRQISLVRADAKGGKVVLSGLVSQANFRKSVQIFANYRSGKRKGRKSAFRRITTATAGSTGEFVARVRRPPARLFKKARFYARVGGARSVALKLPQSLASTSVRLTGGQLVIRGRVQRSVLGKRNEVVVKRVVCGGYRTVGSAKPTKSGRYTVRFPAPALAAAALYRAETKVLARPKSKRYVRQFARAIGITLTGQSG